MERTGLWRRWELWLDPCLLRLLPASSGAFVDVGVHLGQTLLKLKTLAPERRYVGFEPNAGALVHARRMARRRGLSDCWFYPAALGRSHGVATLRSRGGDADPEASIVPGFRGESFYRGLRVVPVLAGDEVLAGLRPVALVKIDVEGGESDVLRGMAGTLAADRPPVLCEVLPVYEASSAQGALRLERQQDMEALLSSLDYRIMRIRRDGRLMPLTTIGIHAALDACDYLFLPGERLPEVRDLVGVAS